MINACHAMFAIHGFLVAWLFAKIKSFEIKEKHLKADIESLKREIYNCRRRME